MIKILPIDKSDGSFVRGWGRHQFSHKKITPPEAFRRVERGASSIMNLTYFSVLSRASINLIGYTPNNI